jgi:hypothetical protein
MRVTGIILLITATLIVVSCASETKEATTEKKVEEPKKEQVSDAPQKETPTKEKDQAPYNYSGTIDKFAIRAQLDFQEAEHEEGSGAIRIPVTGYYYYESTGIKIPLEGEANGIGMIFLTAKTSGGNEHFDGEGTSDEQLGDYKGTWSKGKKQLEFVLKSK